MPDRRTEAEDFTTETRPDFYTLSVTPRGHEMSIPVARCPVAVCL
jgi:hypothetical protein